MSLSWLVATLLIPPFLLIGLAVFVWQRQSSRKGLEFILLVAAVALWGLASAVEKLFVNLDAKIWIAKFQYLGIVAVAPCCVAVALSSRGQSPRRLARPLLLLSLPSLLALGAVMTNEWHKLFWRTVRVDFAAGIPILKLGYGPGFWLHAAWAYTLVAAAVALLISKWARSWSYYRGEAVWVLVGIAAPIAANLTYLTHADSPSNLDLTPAAFSVTALCLGWPLLLRDGLFDVVRLARKEILDHMADAVLVVDLRERIIYVNQSARRLFGLMRARIPCTLHAVPGDRADLLQPDSAVSDVARECEIDVEGAKRSFELTSAGLRDPTGELVSRLLVLRDVTARERAGARIRANEDALRKVIDLVPHLIYATDEAGRFLFVNQATVAALGKPPDRILGRDLVDLRFLPSEVEKVRAGDLAVLERGERRSHNESITAPDGSIVVFHTTKIPFTYPPTGAAAVLGISIDVTEQLQNEEKIRQLAFFDSLTGLPNRPRFLSRLSHALETAKRRNTQLSVLFLDLDHFKDVNDRLGHASGDTLLREVSQRLQSAVRFSDHLAFHGHPEPTEAVSRFAGDEFTILLTHTNDRTDGARVARRILDAVSQPFEVGGESVSIRMSIGMASYPEDGDDVDTLMRCADQAMYAAKRSRQGFASSDSHAE